MRAGSHAGKCCVITSTSVIPSDHTSLAVEIPCVSTSGASYRLMVRGTSPAGRKLSLDNFT